MLKGVPIIFNINGARIEIGDNCTMLLQPIKQFFPIFISRLGISAEFPPPDSANSLFLVSASIG
mgnify:CR=1 FL=1